MSSWMDKAKKFREDHKETLDKLEAKGRELAEQGKGKLEEARERFDEEQTKREGAKPDAEAKPDVPADDGVATPPADPPQDAPPPAPPAGSPPPPPPPPAAA